MFDYENIDRSGNETNGDDYDLMVTTDHTDHESDDSHHVQRETSSS